MAVDAAQQDIACVCGTNSTEYSVLMPEIVPAASTTPNRYRVAPKGKMGCPFGSVDADAEGMAGRVEEHPEGRARLVLVLGGAKAEHRLLGGIQVVDHDIQVHLLRN